MSHFSSYLCIVKTSIKRVKSRINFELFRAEEVKSKAQSDIKREFKNYNSINNLKLKKGKELWQRLQF